MTRTYCDRCGKELEYADTARVQLDVRRAFSSSPAGDTSSSFQALDLCPSCVDGVVLAVQAALAVPA